MDFHSPAHGRRTLPHGNPTAELQDEAETTALFHAFYKRGKRADGTHLPSLYLRCARAHGQVSVRLKL